MGFTLHTLRVLEAFLSISYAGSPHKNHSTAVMALMMVVEVVKVLMMILNVCFLIFQMRKHFTNLVWLWDYPFSLLVSSPVGSNKAAGAWIKLWPQINEQFWFYFGHKLIAMFCGKFSTQKRPKYQQQQICYKYITTCSPYHLTNQLTDWPTGISWRVEMLLHLKDRTKATIIKIKTG